jgi:hypothetical protein
LAAVANRQGRLERIARARELANSALEQLPNDHRIHRVAAAMLYLAEGAKSEGQFRFGNSDPQVIRYWLHLLRSNFDIDESKFRIQVMYRADQNIEELEHYWSMVTGIKRFIKGHLDLRTQGKATKRADYKGVCSICYHDVALRRYLDALAQGLMERAVGALR